MRKEGADTWIETWSNQINGGLLQACKLSTMCSKIYADAVFGFLAWSPDLSKVVFVGEVPAKSKFMNPWDLPEKLDDEHTWQEDKFIYKEDFGELMTGKTEAALFVYDLLDN